MEEQIDEASTRFLRYKLSELLPESDWLFLDQESRYVLQMRLSENRLMMPVELQKLTDQEFELVRELLNFFPDWAPYENLVSVLKHEDIKRSRKRLFAAIDARDTYPVLHPIINVMHRCRQKMLLFGIDIVPVLLTGYMLKADEASPYRTFYKKKEAR